jgi:hypothetical protein
MEDIFIHDAEDPNLKDKSIKSNIIKDWNQIF